VSLEGRWRKVCTGKGKKQLPGVMEIVYIIIGMVVPWEIHLSKLNELHM
jgi:hypothetical protein